jgi:ABC-type nickel/cobalt efflux system permease component RcnA
VYVCVCVCCTCTLMSHTEITERCWQEECSVLIAVCATHMCYRYITNKAKNLRALHHPHTKGCACGDTLTHTHTNTHTNTRAYGHAGVAHIELPGTSANKWMSTQTDWCASLYSLQLTNHVPPHLHLLCYPWPFL